MTKADAPLLVYGTAFSPYSEKARWALEHHGVRYEWSEHVPMFGERKLRRLAATTDTRVTAPIAIDGGRILRDSLAIAKHAEAIGTGPRLFGDEPAVMTWVAASDRALDAARALLYRRMLAAPDALRESLPPWIPSPFRGCATPIAAAVWRFISRKYDSAATRDEHAVETLREVLAGMRRTLEGRDTLLDGFSYADIAMAAVLQPIAPVADEYIALGPRSRLAWTEPALASEFGDLVRWRDALYAKYRRR